MSASWHMITQDSDGFFLSAESFRVTDPELRKFRRWRLALDGKPHPALCTCCGRILKRFDVPASPRIKNKSLDISKTYDGYLLLSIRARSFFEDLLPDRMKFGAPSPAQGLSVVDYESFEPIEVDQKKAKTTVGKFCQECRRYGEVLYGTLPGQSPRPAPLAFETELHGTGLYRTDLEFGTTHGQSPQLIAGEEAAKALMREHLSGLRLVQLDG